MRTARLPIRRRLALGLLAALVVALAWFAASWQPAASTYAAHGVTTPALVCPQQRPAGPRASAGAGRQCQLLLVVDLQHRGRVQAAVPDAMPPAAVVAGDSTPGAVVTMALPAAPRLATDELLAAAAGLILLGAGVGGVGARRVATRRVGAA